MQNPADVFPIHVENLIDEAGEESFPASDPPAVHTERDPVASGTSGPKDPRPRTVAPDIIRPIPLT